jgi:hypothetical protein
MVKKNIGTELVDVYFIKIIHNYEVSLLLTMVS